MRNRNQVVLPINLEIKLPKDDFVYKVAEICDELDYAEKTISILKKKDKSAS